MKKKSSTTNQSPHYELTNHEKTELNINYLLQFIRQVGTLFRVLRVIELVRSAKLQSPPHRSLPFGRDVPTARIQDFDPYHTECGTVYSSEYFITRRSVISAPQGYRILSPLLGRNQST